MINTGSSRLKADTSTFNGREPQHGLWKRHCWHSCHRGRENAHCTRGSHSYRTRRENIECGRGHSSQRNAGKQRNRNRRRQIITIGSGNISGGGASSITPRPCTHKEGSFIQVDENNHQKVCLICGEEIAHEPNKEGDFCTDCWYGAKQIGDNAYYTFD